MITNLVTYLYNKIVEANFPFTDLIAGLVSTQSEQMPTSEESAGLNLIRYPTATVHNGSECDGRELRVIPDGNRKSILYFEENGSYQIDWLGKRGWSSSIRLIFWCNRNLLIADGYGEVTANIEQELIELLAPLRIENAPGFSRLMGEAQRIPQQDASIFGRYTYSETDKQYLRPPYDFFAIDFTFKYNTGVGCIQPITYGAATCF